MKLLRQFYLAGALACFAIAAGIDWPGHLGLPDSHVRAWGNFFCSLGFCFLTLSFLMAG